LSEQKSGSIKRVLEILSFGRNQEKSSQKRGALSAADFDELHILVEKNRGLFPERFNKLALSEHVYFSHQQVELAERLLRILEVHDKHDINVPAEKLVERDLLPTFSLSKPDKERVLDLCSDMRKIVLSSNFFDEAHTVLLLNRITAVEKQVLEKRGLLDVVRGGVAEVGETLGKFGRDIKPLTDRFNEVLKITRDSSPEYSRIPAPEEVLQIEGPETEEGEESEVSET
jgi:hypothetical protein